VPARAGGAGGFAGNGGTNTATGGSNLINIRILLSQIKIRDILNIHYLVKCKLNPIIVHNILILFL